MSLTFKWTSKDLVKQGRVTEEEIENLKSWHSKQDFPDFTDEQLVCFLLSCNKDLQLTYKTIEENVKVKGNHPEMFNGRNIETEDFQMQLKSTQCFILPKRTVDGDVIIMHRLSNASSNFNHEICMKLLFMNIDMALHDDPPHGFIYLVDMSGSSYKQAFGLRYNVIKTLINYFQYGLPVKFKGLHVINVAWFMSKVMGIISPWLKLEILDKLYFYPKSIAEESIHNDQFPKNCMPKDYDGYLSSSEELHQENCENLRKLKPYFEAEELQRLSWKSSSQIKT